jgi:molecular chaperone HscB
VAHLKLDDDDFTLFGLPQRFAIDRDALAARWRELQGEVHPDRFAGEAAAARRVAMQWAVRVNQAYQRLKDPLQRGAYLCELRGAAIDAQRNTAMPAEFLIQQMAWREALDGAQGLAEVEAIERQIEAHERGLIERLGQTLDQQHDAAGAAQQVRALMFVARLRDDIRRRLEALDA